MEQIASLDNIHLAYYKACRGKQGKKEVARFRELLITMLPYCKKVLLKEM